MKFDLKTLTRTAILIALTLGFQSFGFAQPITGPVINAILLVASAIIGALSGLIIGSITPWVAYAVGITKLAPAIPVIIAGNLSLVIVFSALFKANRYIAAVLASVVKWLVMTAGVKYLIATNVKLPPPVVASLTIVQLWTALGGSALALLVIASLQAWQRRPPRRQ